jgi:enolase-phosphatase E1
LALGPPDAGIPNDRRLDSPTRDGTTARASGHHKDSLMPDTALLLDIEGTTTSISFVYESLFPYAARAIPAFLASHAARTEVNEAVDRILADASDDERRLPRVDATVAVVRRQMAGDVKATGLKMLQGLVWRHGYEAGDIKGHVYADVPLAFAAWSKAQRPIAIYSSGSILAQQLLFRHSIVGDLTPFISGHYDTTSGPKQASASYLAICSAWKRAPASITFCTDVPGEAEAARAAGLNAVLLMRPGNPPLPPQQAVAVHADFTRI